KPICCCQHICFIGDLTLDEIQQKGCKECPQHWRNHPASRNACQAFPVDNAQAACSDTGPHNPPHNGVGRGHWSTDVSCQVQPKRSGQQGCHHQPDEFSRISHQGGVNNAALDGTDNLT